LGRFPRRRGGGRARQQRERIVPGNISLAGGGQPFGDSATFADADEGPFIALVAFTSCGQDAYDLQDGIFPHCVSDTGDPASTPGAQYNGSIFNAFTASAGAEVTAVFDAPTGVLQGAVDLPPGASIAAGSAFVSSSISGASGFDFFAAQAVAALDTQGSYQVRSIPDGQQSATFNVQLDSGTRFHFSSDVSGGQTTIDASNFVYVMGTFGWNGFAATSASLTLS
jgi:hypothetical protein